MAGLETAGSVLRGETMTGRVWFCGIFPWWLSDALSDVYQSLISYDPRMTTPQRNTALFQQRNRTAPNGWLSSLNEEKGVRLTKSGTSEIANQTSLLFPQHAGGNVDGYETEEPSPRMRHTAVRVQALQEAGKLSAFLPLPCVADFHAVAFTRRGYS